MHRKVEQLQLKRIKSKLFTAEYYEFEVEDKAIRYVISNSLSRRRTETLFDKEPTTAPWLETFKPGEVFVDIGANVGMYSIYAAVVSGANVYAFEPESQNYAELNKNIFLNGLHNQVKAYCMAMLDKEQVSQIMLSAFGPAFAHHDFEKSSWEKGEMQIGQLHVKDEERLPQGCISMPLDKLVADGSVPSPNHIKIDVDGFEHKVIEGMQKTLRNPGLKSVLFEVDFKLPESMKTLETLLSQGWTYSRDQLRTNRHEVLAWEQFEKRMTDRKGGQNFILYKDGLYDDYFAEFTQGFVPPHPHEEKPKAPEPVQIPVKQPFLHRVKSKIKSFRVAP